MMVYLDDSTSQRLQPEYDRALAESPVTSIEESVFRAWRSDPNSILPKARKATIIREANDAYSVLHGEETTAEERELVASWRLKDIYNLGIHEVEWVSAFDEVRFNTAFNLPGFAELGKRLVFEQLGISIEESTVAKFISSRNVTPVSVLWNALGPDLSLHFPGRLGNLFIPPDQVKDVMEKVERLLSRFSLETMLQPALRYARNDMSASAIKETIHALPSALQAAENRGGGLLALGFSAP